MTDRTSLDGRVTCLLNLCEVNARRVGGKQKAEQRPGGHTKWQQWRRKRNVCTQKEEDSQTFFSRFGQNETPGSSSSSAAELGRDLTCCRAATSS
jgi:hypothetical protein